MTDRRYHHFINYRLNMQLKGWLKLSLAYKAVISSSSERATQLFPPFTISLKSNFNVLFIQNVYREEINVDTAEKNC